MKKLSILLLALAIAAFAVPAMAGDVSMSGEYGLGGWAESNGTDSSMMEHWLDLDVQVTEGDVTFSWRVELADTDLFTGLGIGAHDSPSWPGGDYPKGVFDNFNVKWQASDALAFKGGVYGISDNNALVFDSALYGSATMGIMYGLDVADLGFYLSKETDGDEDDDTVMAFTAAGELGPAAVSLVYGSRTNDAGVTSNAEGSALYFDADFAAGPVGVNFAYGSESNDDSGLDGSAMILGLGLEELVGFDL